MLGISAKNRKPHKRAESWGYRIHDAAAQFRFELHGALASGDVHELDQCWRTAASTIGGKALVVDLTSLTAIDESGRELLSRWRQAGAEFVAGPQSLSIVEGWNSTGSVIRSTETGSARLSSLSLQTVMPLAVVLFSLLLPATLLGGDAGTARGAESESAPNLALARYVAGLAGSQPWGAETVEIEASLPKLKEQGRFRAIRRLLPLGKPEYQVFELNGSRTVKQQVIARYLAAEIEAARMSPSAVAVTPANYGFRYAGSVGAEGNLVYVFRITPRKKREGLIQGVLWIEAATGAAVRQSGYLVKRPSIFVKRVDVTRETSLHNGVAESRVTHLAVETRLVGRAELTIHERPCVECVDTAVSGSN